jgi:hypothetical protein
MHSSETVVKIYYTRRLHDITTQKTKIKIQMGDQNNLQQHSFLLCTKRVLVDWDYKYLFQNKSLQILSKRTHMKTPSPTHPYIIVGVYCSHVFMVFLSLSRQMLGYYLETRS